MFNPENFPQTPNDKESDIKNPEPTTQKQEREKPFDFKINITDHSADLKKNINKDQLRELYTDIKKDGINSVRYDWHWRNIEPAPGSYDNDSLTHYAEAKEAMAESGLEAPTIILSNPPEWAKKLYQEDKEKFFEAFRNYADAVVASLQNAGEEKVSRVQILNELNNTIYTPVALEDIPKLCEITQESFKIYNPDIKLSCTVIAGNIQNVGKKFGMGEPIQEFLPKLKEVADSFDSIAVDYYPGTWHMPAGQLATGNFKEMFKNLELLKETFEELATWGKEYELGEVGISTNTSLRDEKTQRYFFDVFFRSFRQLMVDMRSRGLKLPNRIGLYQAINDAPIEQNWKDKILRKISPEGDFGMRTEKGERKLILRGNRHIAELPGSQQESQLSRIINYLK